ncbi:MAG: DUF3344 domain-containing protein [Prevotella sp.]|nr:DUF3344 domain-containing protein [Prevotella sp.]
MRKILLFTFALLLTAVTGAWAQYTVTLNSEYTSVPTVYAGVQNYMTLTVKNTGSTAASNVAVTVSLSGEIIFEETIDNIPAGETATLHFYDTTIRPITENTVKGNNNENAVYTVSVGGAEQGDFSFVILYNGYLGKDYEYPSANPSLRIDNFTGDVQILTGTNYSSASNTSRDDVFSIELGDGESVYRALLYVSYNWDKAPGGDFNDWTTTFNDNNITKSDSYRDQINMGGASGNYGYGLVIYDVTEHVVNGDNTFRLEKTAGNVAVYPSSLIVMVNKPSGTPKSVYILEEADLLSHSYINGNNEYVDAIYESSFENVASGDATLYVFAASAQAGEGDLIINDEEYSNVWDGTSSTFDTFQTTVAPGDVSVQFKATGSTILALHQMLVVENPGVVKAKEGKTGEYWATYYNVSRSYTADANTTVFQAALSDNQLTLTAVPDREIPAGKAVILKSSASNIVLTPATTTQTLSDNQLQGTTTAITGAAGNIYVLNKGENGVGFYKLSAVGTLAPGKAYLTYDGGGGESNFFGFDEETTGIHSVDGLPFTVDSFFDLSGRKVTNPTKGLYIVNGKKVVYNR